MAEWTLDDVVRILDEVASLAGTAHREVQSHALQPGVAPRLLGRAPQVGGAHAVAPHRGEPLQHDPCAGLLGQQECQVLGAGDGVYHPAVQPPVERRPPRAPGGEDEQAAVVALGDLGQLLVAADRERVGLQPVGAPGQAEAMAVALGDRVMSQRSGRS